LPVIVFRGERLWLAAAPLSVGTLSPWLPGYSAPELEPKLPLVEGLDPSVDVFSLGVILAECLLGRFPFPRSSYVGLLQAQFGRQHATLPSTPLGNVIARALDPDPRARPTLDELAASAA